MLTYGHNRRLVAAVQLLQLFVLSVLALLALVFFFERLHLLTVVLIGSIFVFQAVKPAIKRLNRRLPLWASILVVFLAALIIVGAAFAYLIPAISNNVKEFVANIPATEQHLSTIINDSKNPILRRLPLPVRELVHRLPSRFAGSFGGAGGTEAASKGLHAFTTLISIPAALILIPILTIYLLIDAVRVREAFLRMFPPHATPKARKILREIDDVLGGYIRGQLLVALIVGILMTALLAGLHVPYAAALGMLGGVLEIVPYAGAIIGGAIAVIAALISNGALNAAFVTLGLIAINQIEGHVIAPIVVGENVKLRPLTIVLALLTGGELFGIMGMLVAVPVAGIINVLLTNFVIRRNVDGAYDAQSAPTAASRRF